MLLIHGIPFRRLPIVTSVVESGKEVRGSEIFISSITTLMCWIGIVIKVSLAVGYVMSVLPVRMMRPMGFTNIGSMCVELVELITIRGTVLGRCHEEVYKSGLLLRLLLAGRERRRRQRERWVIRGGRDLARARGGKCCHSDRRASTGCQWCIHIDFEWSGRSIPCDHYLRNGRLIPNRFWLLGSHKVNATLEGHRQVLPFAGTIEGV